MKVVHEWIKMWQVHLKPIAQVNFFTSLFEKKKKTSLCFHQTLDEKHTKNINNFFISFEFWGWYL